MNNFKLIDCINETTGIVEYIAKFCEFDDITIDHFKGRFPNIVISNEKPFETYKGRYNDIDIIKIIEENIPEDKKAANHSKKLKEELFKPIEKQNEKLIYELLDTLKKLLKDGQFQPFDVDKVKRIIDVFKERYVISIVLGRYYHQRRTIVLYKQNIIDTAINKDIYSNMKRVLTHEMFHAIHHFLFDGAKQVRSKFGKNGYGSIVKEGLARLIEYNYCKDTLNTKLATKYCDELEKSWNNNFFEVYPYSAAKYLEEYSSLRNEKVALIHRLITDSKPDFINAYQDIVYLYKLNEGFDKILDNDKSISYRGYYKHYISLDKKRYIINSITKNQNQVLDLIANEIKKEIKENGKDKNTESFSNLLKRKLREKNISNSKCIENSRLNKDAFYKILRGETIPKPRTVAQLAIGLMADVNEYEELITVAKCPKYYIETDPLAIIEVYIKHSVYDWDDIESAFVDLTGNTLVNYKGREALDE